MSASGGKRKEPTYTSTIRAYSCRVIAARLQSELSPVPMDEYPVHPSHVPVNALTGTCIFGRSSRRLHCCCSAATLRVGSYVASYKRRNDVKPKRVVEPADRSNVRD